MQSNSIFAKDNTNASINERASMLSEHRLKYIDDKHQMILEKLDNVRYGMISSLNNRDLKTFSDLHTSITNALNLYYSRALSLNATIPFELILLKLEHYPSDPNFKAATNKYNESVINGSINVIIEHIELNTLQAKENVIRNSLAEASENKNGCSIL